MKHFRVAVAVAAIASRFIGAPIAAANNVSLTIPNLEWLKEAEKYLEKEQLQLKVHIGVDSGMGRIGFNEDEDFIAANKFLQNNMT